MGYACPVCETPHRDAEHLANHLAFTAMLHGDDHAEWLDERVPDWEACGPADLAERVVDHVEETEYDAVFEDTVGDDAGGSFGHDHRHDHHERVADAARRSPVDTGGDLDPETRQVLAEARELTREMLDDGEDGDDEDGAGGGDETDEDGAGGEDGTDGEDGGDDAGTGEGGDASDTGDE
jgi:hypothetical protein